MDISPFTSFVVGVAAGLAVLGLLAPSLNRRLHTRCREDVAKLERALRDLREERADDRQTNRRLRHELAIKTPANFETTRQDRDWALEELDKLRAELADRDRSLREARVAIQEIRSQLEAGRFGARATPPAAADFDQASAS